MTSRRGHTGSKCDSSSDVCNSDLISAGTLGLNTSNASVATLTQSGGTLNGSGILTVSGLSNLSGGTESGSGATIAQGGAAFTSPGFILDGTRKLQPGGTSPATGTFC